MAKLTEEKCLDIILNHINEPRIGKPDNSYSLSLLKLRSYF